MPWAGWKSAAVTAGAGGAPPPAGLPLPAVGSVGPTSGLFSTELEQPPTAIAATKMTTAAVSLFMNFSPEFSCVGSVRSMRRTYGAVGAVGYAWAPKGGKPRRREREQREASKKRKTSRIRARR